MVLKKQRYKGGFHGLLAPVIPKAPRSLRRRNQHKKPSENGENCAFELLAAAADKLLQEQESESSTSTAVPEEVVKDEPLEVIPENDSGSDHASIVTKEVDPDTIMEAIEGKSGNLCDDLKNCLEPCVNTRVANKSRVHLSFYRDPFHGSCFPDSGNVNVNIRDDDENYIRHNNCINGDDDEKYIRHNNCINRAFGSRSHAGYKRMRRMMRSRYWKVARKMKDYEFQNGSGGGVKSFYNRRKNIFKRRKLSHQKSRKSHLKKANNESISNLVKFSINSFKVPELYIEVPETATVGSLKRSVMEAVKAIVHGKLHVGVLVQGNKVRDDDRTLQQSGISQHCNLDTLGFTLEPSPPEASSFLVEHETPSCNKQQLCRFPSSPTTDGGFSTSSPDPLTDMENYAEKNEEVTTLAAEVTTKEPMEDSKALVLVPPLDAEVLAAVPLNEKPNKRYECSQRRIRRPFSVSEVEALVEAVETLGAGRWRDVKMRAFNDADHRTYVDLKDKWKTLVHTASISPQQRRGEPVPQEVLDRVLAAHAYWSQHQHAKKQQKTSEAQM